MLDVAPLTPELALSAALGLAGLGGLLIGALVLIVLSLANAYDVFLCAWSDWLDRDER